MLEAAATLPPIVLSDLFGISTTTANAWFTYTQTNWAEFLTARDNPYRDRSGNSTEGLDAVLPHAQR